MTNINNSKTGTINSELLAETIIASGYKRSYIADKLGISVMTLGRKVNGETDFKISEMRTLIALLKLDAETTRLIFLL